MQFVDAESQNRHGCYVSLHAILTVPVSICAVMLLPHCRQLNVTDFKTKMLANDANQK